MRFGALLLVLLAVACGEEPASEAPPAPAPFELREVLGPALAALETELAGAEAAPPAADERLFEQVNGLVQFLQSARGALRSTGLEEARALGDAAVPVVTEILSDAGRPDGERVVAAEILGEIGTPRAAEALLVRVETAPEAWVRSNCAYQLGRGGHEWTIPRMILRLRDYYEMDVSAFLWIGSALARMGNYCAVERMLNVYREGATEELRAEAEARLVELAAESGVGDSGEVAALWAAGDPEGRLSLPERGPRFDREVWRRIEILKEFQLRGVDDSRFVLTRLGPHTAGIMAEALHDENVYVREQVAQSLERMGPRGAVAAPVLVEALADPEIGPQAAASLGALRHGPARPALERCLGPRNELDLRVAAARALGWLRDPAAAPALRPLLAEIEPADLRQAAAESLVYSESGDEVVGLLLDYAVSMEVEPVSSELALRVWLARRAEESEEAARVLVEWDAVSVETEDATTTTAQRRALREARVALLRAELDSL